MPDVAADPIGKIMNPQAIEKAIANTKKKMEEAAKKLEFIEAAQYRDEMRRLQVLLNDR